MKKTCSGCGREAKEGETFISFVPIEEWWLHLFENQYCEKCASQRREDEIH